MKRIKQSFLCLLLVMTMFVGGTLTVFATNTNGFGGAVKTKYGEVANGKHYDLEEAIKVNGDTKSQYTSGELVRSDGLLEETKFDDLTAKSQRECIEDLMQAAQEVDEAGTYTDADYQNWMQKLEQQDGVGSKLMTTLMQNTKPDFATANKLYEPFSGTVGTILGILSIVLMAALALVMVLDLSYIAIPFVRNFLDGGADGQNGSGGVKSRFVSWEAYNAVMSVENGGGGNGQSSDNKSAVGIYFKKRIVMLLILGLCLLYLVQGEIFTLVGYFMDLVSGFLDIG